MEPGPWTFGWDQVFAVVTAFLALANVFILGAATLIARSTVSRIRDERFANRQAEVADECLRIVYEVHDSLRHVREDVFLEEDEYSAYRERLESEPIFDAIQEIKPRVKAYIGSDAFNRLEDILQITRDLKAAAWKLYGPGKVTDLQKRDADKVAHFTGLSTDPIEVRYLKIERETESELLPIIGRKD